MKLSFKSGFLALASAAAIFASLPCATVQAAGADGCSAQVDRVKQALISGRRIDAVSVKTLRGCLLGQPGAIADALGRQAGGTALANPEAAATVVASFQNPLLCLDFNSNGTISSTSPTWHVLSGGYFGVPGILTIFGYSGSFYLGGFSSFGLTIGPFSIEFLSPFGGLLSGSQVAGCPAG